MGSIQPRNAEPNPFPYTLSDWRLMVEQPDSGTRHSNPVPVADLNHIVIPDRTAGLRDTGYTASVGPLDVVPKGEERI